MQRLSITQDTDWDYFVAHHWEQEPCVLRLSTKAEAIFDQTALFAALINGSDEWISSRDHRFSIWLDGVSLQDYTPALAKPLHQDVSGYVEAVLRETGATEMTYTQYNLQVDDERLWAAAREFITPLVERVGVPSYEVDLDTFLGRYKATPRGIHTDQASTFMHVMAGSKTMVVWPPDHFSEESYQIVGRKLRKTIIGANLPTALESGQILRGVPGEVLYWPSSYWHLSVSDSSEELSVALNVGFMLAEADTTTFNVAVNKIVTALSQQHLPEATIPTPKPEADGQLTDVGLSDRELNMLQQLRRLTTGTALNDLLLDEWLKRVSARGFRLVPPARAATPLTDEKALQVDARYPLFYRRTNDGCRLYGNGLMIKLGGCQTVSTMLSLLNSGHQVTVADLRAATASAPEDWEDIVTVLQRLYTARALDVSE